MRRILIPALAVTLFWTSFATAQPVGRNPVSDVRIWYHQFLGREPDQGGLIFWTDHLRSGTHPAVVLSGILGSDEYDARAGGTPEEFVRSLFVDLARREPTNRELHYWSSRLAAEANKDLAYALLMIYPRAWERPGEGASIGSR